MPAVTFNRAIVEYCWRALARCTAAVSNAETLLILPTIEEIYFIRNGITRKQFLSSTNQVKSKIKLKKAMHR